MKRKLNTEQLARICGGRARVYFRSIPEDSDMKKGARVYRDRTDSLEDDDKGNGPDVHIVVRR
jgi:hypothetical protein